MLVEYIIYIYIIRSMFTTYEYFSSMHSMDTKYSRVILVIIICIYNITK